jgi:hypothetical protein
VPAVLLPPLPPKAPLLQVGPRHSFFCYPHQTKRAREQACFQKLCGSASWGGTKASDCMSVCLSCVYGTVPKNPHRHPPPNLHCCLSVCLPACLSVCPSVSPTSPLQPYVGAHKCDSRLSRVQSYTSTHLQWRECDVHRSCRSRRCGSGSRHQWSRCFGWDRGQLFLLPVLDNRRAGSFGIGALLGG